MQHPTEITRARRLLAVAITVAVTLLLAVEPVLAESPTAASPSADDAVGEPRDGSLHGLIAQLAAAVEQARAVTAPPAIPEGAIRPCRDEPAADVPSLVAAVFRCHLAKAGIPEPEIRQIVAEAVVISWCESEWDPSAVVFDGRYLDTPHPRTGSHYSAAGLFQFIRRVADDWIEGGYAHVTDARRNVDAAARLYLHNRIRGYFGWADWACAAANDGFRATSVLPGQPGGPAALPEWAYSY